MLETKPLQVIPTGSYDNRIFLAITKENFTSTLETKDFECVYNLDITGGETRIESGEESIGSTSKCFLFQGRQKDVFGSQTLELDFHASIIRCTKCLSEELKKCFLQYANRFSKNKKSKCNRRFNAARSCNRGQVK